MKKATEEYVSCVPEFLGFLDDRVRRRDSGDRQKTGTLKQDEGQLLIRTRTFVN